MEDVRYCRDYPFNPAASLYSMDDQRIRHGGCFPVEILSTASGRPAQQYSDF